MDKFTVDLDQVLNDFEYSELTDQYSNASKILPVAPPSSTTTASAASYVSKHSINNVFHSLNEYLNTNINLNHIEPPIDNNEGSRRSSSDRDISFANGKTDETDVDNKFETLRLDNNNENSQLIDVTDEVQVKVNNSPEYTQLSDETDTNVSNSNIETSLEDCPTDFTTASDISESDKKPEVVGESLKVESDNDEDDSDSSKENAKEIVVEQENISLQAELMQAEDRKALNDDDVDDEHTQDDLPSLDNVKYDVVGFDNNLKLDDNEINKLLSELEEDDDLVFETNETEDLIKEEIKRVVESNDEPKEESVDSKTVKPENLITVDSLEDITGLQETKEIVEEILEKISPELKVEKKEIEAPCEEIKVAENVKTEEPEQFEESIENLIKSEQELTKNNKDSSNETVQGMENTEIQIKKEISQESLPRPQNLPLSKDLTENNRKIDLIGGPGSTPYNNIYINNEIGQQEGNNSDDVECSSTSSQSFSDGSSTVSTASTEDIQDKNDVANLDDTKAELENSEEQFHDSHPSEIATEADVMPTAVAAGSDRVVQASSSSSEKSWLGKEAPLWIPDAEASSCLHCDMKFTVLKRRHHCRACGLVLCSKCCHLRFRLEYLDAEARVCNKCHDILNKESSSSSSSDLSPETGNSPHHRPNPNNPSEYCSTVSPLEQVSSSAANPPPAIMVPIGVLKRKGSNKVKSNKSVMFCDGIRPGSDLTNLDNDFNYNNTVTKKLEKTNVSVGKVRNLPIIDSDTNTFIPKNENSLPPTITTNKTDIKYTECLNNLSIVESLKTEQMTFAIHISLQVHVKIINMSCCMNKQAWCFATEGLINVGQDEVVYIIEYIEGESVVPKDVFYHITNIYNEAVKGSAIKEMGLSLHNSANFLDSKNHAGFVYIRPTFQCLENIIKPKDPYIIGILVHRWETPWAKLFPLRLILRLGAEYRYYPSPIISTRHRDSVYVEIGHTIINILADFRNFSYTLPQIRGLTIHMEDKNTTVNIPANRYDQVIKSLNNSSDHILAFAGNFSLEADSHLVCIQDTQGNENCYSTHAINIHNKPRKITGASFIVFNGALKSSSGLTAKSNIIEDGLMVQVLPEHLEQIRESLRAMKNYTISCGCIGEDASDETVQIVWSENDSNFNLGIVSTIDNMSLSGIPSIRVHNGKNYICHNGSRIIRWTEVFIIQNGEDNPKNQEPVDISKVSEGIARATCDALVKYIDLLITNNFQKIGIRTTLHADNVSYCAGSNGTKLPPIYMKSLDNELIPVLHRITSNNFGENSVILELIFRILNV